MEFAEIMFHAESSNCSFVVIYSINRNADMKHELGRSSIYVKYDRNNQYDRKILVENIEFAI